MLTEVEVFLASTRSKGVEQALERLTVITVDGLEVLTALDDKC